MVDDWTNHIRTNLKGFLRELAECCVSCQRKPETIQVVYATKYLNPEQLAVFLDMLRELGQLPAIIGESRVQEAIKKMSNIKYQIAKININNQKLVKASNFPFKLILIGNLQKNKINKALSIFTEIHSVDSLELAEAINMRMGRIKNQESRIKDKKLPIFLEVNVSGEKSKHGFRPEEVDKSLKELKKFNALEIKGLMTMAPYFHNPEQARPIFRKLKQMANQHNLLTSMGMSHDWKVAVNEGADYIRIGERIFR